MRVADIESIRIKLASPEDILSWSHGEVSKPETINYRTQRPEKDGLFCEKIFGPTKDYECYCGKYRKIRYKGIVCDKCGVEVTKSSVRRERMGHIKLATPCSHIWFLRGVPSRMGMVLGIPASQLESIIYFASYIVSEVRESEKKRVLEEIEKEYETKTRSTKSEIRNKSKIQNPLDAKQTPRPGRVASQTKEQKVNLNELKAARDRAREEVLALKSLRILSELEYREFSLKYGELFEAGTGAETLRQIFSRIDLKKLAAELAREVEKISETVAKKKIIRRLRLIEKMAAAGVRPEWMFLTVLPVLPPDLRPMVQLDGGRYASSDLNDLYRRVINRNNRLKYLLEIDAPEVIVRNEKRMLQEAVDALIDNGMRKGQTTTATTGGKRLLKSLADMLKGKQGRFRQNLLGKRVDYSGRSVIAVGPELRLSQCGLPKKMALELFKPFVIQKIIERELAYNVRGAARLIEEETAEVWAILEEVVKNKLVLLNRAPTLHRLGVQAFQPILVEGQVIRVHPLVCKAFNADFDGDQMAVHVPLSDEAQQEAREIMLSQYNLLKPANGLPIVSPTQDIILGCYFLTRLGENKKGEGKIFSSVEEAKMAYDLGYLDLEACIRVRMPLAINQQKSVLTETSVGRVIFNEALPEDYPFVNRLVNSKVLEEIISDIIQTKDTSQTVDCLDRIKSVGFNYSTWSGVTWGMDDLTVPKEKGRIIKQAEKEVELTDNYYRKGLLSREERTSKIIEVWQKAKLEIEKLVPQALAADGPIFSIIDSGSRGSWSQLVQVGGMKGLVINPAGQIIELPIKSSYKEGFDVLEFFISTHGARKGATDTALRTSTAGYLTRRLVDVAHEVVISEEDCKDNKGITVFREDAEEIGQNFRFKILGRAAAEDVQSPQEKVIVKKGKIIDLQKTKEIIEAGVKEVRVFSPMSCKTGYGVCQKCYGWSLGNNQPVKLGETVGIVAAQAIGEPGTQLTMRTFHTGGVASGGDITQGLPRVQEVFERRSPRGKTMLSTVEGRVEEITPDRVVRIKALTEGTKSKTKEQPKKGLVVEYKIPAKRVILVEKGQEVKKGEPLCEGSVDLTELFKLTGVEETQRHIVKEIQKIYNSQGAVIHDKHIEVIVRQMFSRVKIKDAGDTDFNKGEMRERAYVLEVNAGLSAGAKEAVYQPLVLGISDVSLTTESFLSAASFQETSRVLIKAAIEGRVDRLRGLKENVMIGKLIPAGTGFRKPLN